MGEEKTRKYGLDFLKGIAACFVVFMHARFPDAFGEYMAKIGTFAVPVFFMTSGYFSFNATKSKTLKSIKRTATYLFVAYLLNLIRIVVEMGFDLGMVLSFFKTEVFTASHLMKVVILSQSKISGVAWFLISLLVCYMLKYLLGKNLRYLGYLGIVVGVVGIIPPVSGYMGLPINNPWINGIPFFVIGELLRGNNAFVKEKIGNGLLMVAAVAGFILIIVACYYAKQWWHIGTLLLSPSLFVLFSRMDMKFNKFCLLGSVYAFFIYIVHPLVMHVYDAVRLNISATESWLRPLIILAITILLAVSYYGLKRVGLSDEKNRI